MKRGRRPEPLPALPPEQMQHELEALEAESERRRALGEAPQKMRGDPSAPTVTDLIGADMRYLDELRARQARGEMTAEEANAEFAAYLERNKDQWDEAEPR